MEDLVGGILAAGSLEAGVRHNTLPAAVGKLAEVAVARRQYPYSG